MRISQARPGPGRRAASESTSAGPVPAASSSFLPNPAPPGVWPAAPRFSLYRGPADGARSVVACRRWRSCGRRTCCGSGCCPDTRGASSRAPRPSSSPPLPPATPRLTSLPPSSRLRDQCRCGGLATARAGRGSPAGRVRPQDQAAGRCGRDSAWFSDALSQPVPVSTSSCAWLPGLAACWYRRHGAGAGAPSPPTSHGAGD